MKEKEHKNPNSIELMGYIPAQPQSDSNGEIKQNNNSKRNGEPHYTHHRVDFKDEDDDEGGFTEIPLNGRADPASSQPVDHTEVDVEVKQPKWKFWLKKPKDGEEKPAKQEIKRVGFFELYRFADKFDVLLMLVGTLFSMVIGCGFPVNILVYGNVANLFISDAINLNMNATSNYTATRDIFTEIVFFSKFFAVVASVVLVSGYLAVMSWSWTAERQTRRIRTLFFNAILRQDIQWFDTHEVGELNTRISDDISKIHAGMGEKMATFLQWSTTFVAGYVLGFVEGWKLTLVILAISPLLILASAFVAISMRKFTATELKAYAMAGAVAEEVLGAIRTVAAFGGEKKEVERYSANLQEAQKVGIKKGIISGAGQGMIWIIIFSAFALAFYYGGTLIRNEGFSGGQLLMVFFGVLMGSMSLGHAAPNLESFGNARAAAAIVYEIIDQVPEIDSRSEEGLKPEDVKGNVEFDNVGFHYPSRSDVQILKGLSFKVNVGQTVALVGPSGCGKSTTVQLIQRFYDTIRGAVKIDGRDVRSLNVKWLRQNIGVVSQEPVLFATTIRENIRFGKEGATDAEIEQAAREANAHDFIMALPQKYETQVGERGAQLSGGQKQRIAIARALVRNPKILLLDEATSALDNESEAIVQAALDKASEGRTTLIIAHRLSTIKNADLIVGIGDGKVVEIGTHDELMDHRGLYFQLVTSQTRVEDEDESEEEDSSDDASTFSSQEIPRHSYYLEEMVEEYVFKPGSKEEESALSDFGRHLIQRMSSRRSVRSHKSGGSRASFRRMTSAESHRIEEIDREKLEENQGQKKEIEEKLPEPSLKRIMRLNSPEWPFILIGCFSAIFTGAAHPCFAILMGEILKVFAIVDPEEQAASMTLFCGLIFAVGLVSATFQTIQGTMFGISGERLTKRLRHMAFESMLRQEIGWFDEPTNQVGALTARLATDASAVNGATGSRLSTMIQSTANMGTAVVMSFIFGWKLTLVIIGFLPIMVAAGLIQMRLLMGHSRGDQVALVEGGKIAIEAIENMRTVAALTKEKHFADKYSGHFVEVYQSGRRNSHVSGITYAFSQCIIFFAYAAAFSFGAYLVQTGEMEFQNVFRIFGAITFGGMAVGRASGFAPDYSKAKTAAAKLFALFDREPSIDSSCQDGKTMANISGEVRFQDARFVYPTRPEVKVLRGLNLTLKPGQTLALVGSSGCGKSTTIQLIERFYDPVEGQVTLDGYNTKDLNLQWLRGQLGLVSQEPVLFGTSIAQNIAYGDNSREVPMQAIIEAAKAANIHNFISSLPMGYDTNVGDKGAQLSGGQKQRVAIARALVRNPKILLLDEATSALDTESEKIVQEALDKAQEGRTCIVIAHRLSTIQNADQIAVIHSGRVHEQGTHSELMAMQSMYYKLQMASKKVQKA
ncbi:multidrug resistance protein 1 [Lingula anatina]|uniref:Multidrug resistance protein 1 n=1 Tax=Lingula anatina TaxID=7574 RepID=A0A1S3K8D6_LINAN|nr:multidrug resistance protein 1 [Lingula anatina]|eukprot:XP_013418888.1 multidrug resistance protein 1 [Lingula anatina]